MNDIPRFDEILRILLTAQHSRLRLADGRAQKDVRRQT